MINPLSLLKRGTFTQFVGVFPPIGLASSFVIVIDGILKEAVERKSESFCDTCGSEHLSDFISLLQKRNRYPSLKLGSLYSHRCLLCTVDEMGGIMKIFGNKTKKQLPPEFKILTD